MEACVMASTTHAAGLLSQVTGINRAPKDFLPITPSDRSRQDIFLSSNVKLLPANVEDQWKLARLLPEPPQSIILDNSIIKPVPLAVEDMHNDSVLFSIGIAEHCARHEKISQYLMPGSTSGRERFDPAVLSNAVGLHSVAIDMCYLSTLFSEDVFCDIDAGNTYPSILYPKNGFYMSKPLLDFVEDLGFRSMIALHPDGQILFKGSGAELKDLISLVSEFYASKNSMKCSGRAHLIPHFTRMEVAASCTSLPKLQNVTTAPITRPTKIKVKPSTKKKRSRKTVGDRDLYKKNYIHACEDLVSVLFDKSRGKATLLSLKKSGPELPELLMQFSSGIAGTGIAVIFSVFFKAFGGRAPFSAAKLLNTGFGFGLVWLSWAVNQLRDTIIHATKNSACLESNEAVVLRQVDRSVGEIFFRAAAIMALAVLRFA